MWYCVAEWDIKTVICWLLRKNEVSFFGVCVGGSFRSKCPYFFSPPLFSPFSLPVILLLSPAFSFFEYWMWRFLNFVFAMLSASISTKNILHWHKGQNFSLATGGFLLMKNSKRCTERLWEAQHSLSVCESVIDLLLIPSYLIAAQSNKLCRWCFLGSLSISVQPCCLIMTIIIFIYFFCNVGWLGWCEKFISLLTFNSSDRWVLIRSWWRPQNGPLMCVWRWGVIGTDERHPRMGHLCVPTPHY